VVGTLLHLSSAAKEQATRLDGWQSKHVAGAASNCEKPASF